MARHPLAGLIPVAPDPDDPTGLLFVGGRISEEALLEAYAHGFFPWTGAEPIPWCSPDPRALLWPGGLKTGRSLDKRMRNGGYRFSFDRVFPDVMAACALSPRPGQSGTWITPNLEAAWAGLWRRGHAHSVEVWAEDRLVGGLYGLALGAAFFGESMFHAEPDTSKLALKVLCDRVFADGFHFVDCQAMTPHLNRMGALPMARPRYLRLLKLALADARPPAAWG